MRSLPWHALPLSPLLSKSRIPLRRSQIRLRLPPAWLVAHGIPCFPTFSLEWVFPGLGKRSGPFQGPLFIRRNCRNKREKVPDILGLLVQRVKQTVHEYIGCSLAAPRLGLHTCIAGGVGAVPCRGTNSLRGVQHGQKVIHINACVFSDLTTGAMSLWNGLMCCTSEEGRERQREVPWSNQAVCAKKLTRIQSFLGLLRLSLFQAEGRVRAYKCLYKERRDWQGSTSSM